MSPDSKQEQFDSGEVISPQEIERLRWRRVNRILGYARRHLPLYREQMELTGDSLLPISSAEEFAERVPMIRKADVISRVRKTHRAEAGIEAVGRRPITNIVMTSGTQGFNTFAFLTASDLMRGGNLRNALRELWMMKVRPGMRVVTLSPAWHVLALLDARALTDIGALTISPFGTFTARFVPNFIDAVSQLKPEHVLLTLPVLRGVLAECERREASPGEVFRSVRYIGCAGEPISPDLRRQVIEEMELDDLFERGGSSDGMFGGAECIAHRGHHISPDLHYIEIIDPQTGRLMPPGRRGVAVVTNLTLGRSIYIRFNGEDVAEIRKDPCPCGRTSPVVELYGRLDDCVQLNGPLITPYDVRCGVDAFPELRGRPFTIAENDGTLRVRLGGPEAGDDLLTGLSGRLSEGLGVTVVVDYAQDLATGWKGQALGERRHLP